MRIEDIEVVNLRFAYPAGHGFHYAGGRVTARVSSVILVHTNTAHVGIGAAYSHPDLVKIIVERHLAPLLQGADPLRVEELWELMYGLTRWYGRKGAAMSALGGIDIALWDLRGKYAEKPVYELLEGEHAWAPAYASGLFWRDDLTEIEAEAATHMEHGFKRVKMRLGRSEAYDIAAVEAALRGVGSGGEVIVDGSHRYSVAAARRMGAALAERNVFWFEEPFAPECLDEYAAVRGTIDVPLAAGENDFGVQGFRELIRVGAVDIVQPDCVRAGGITECLRIGRLADAAGLRVATHTWSDAVGIVANAHVVSALPNGVTVEVDCTGNAMVDRLLVEPLDVRDGRLRLSRAPGLGIELAQTTVAELSAGYGDWMADGNYSDLIFGREYMTAAEPFGGA